MMGKPGSTRDRILNAGQELILEKGYGGTSVDAILLEADTTKGAFFHHFPSKEDLAFAIIERYAAANRAMLHRFRERASKVSSNPLHRILLVMAFYEDPMSEDVDPVKGCIFTAYGYQSGVFGEQTQQVITDYFAHWLDVIGAMFQDVIDVQSPRRDVSANELAQMALTTIQGGLSLSKNFSEPEFLPGRVQQFRHYVEMLFEDE